MIAVTFFEMGGQPVPKVLFDQAFLVSFFVATIGALLVLPYAKRRPKDKKATWGEAMLASMYVFGLMVIAFGICPDRWIAHADAELGWGTTNIVYGPFDILKPHGDRRLVQPDHHPVAGDPRHRRGRHPRVVLRPADLHLGQVAEAWSDARRHRGRHQQLRPPVGEEGLATCPAPTPTRR